MKEITISPLTRLEGHGKIEIFLNDEGNVEKAYLVIDELRGFENFCRGRPSEDMPQITQRICGVCPTAHHTASVKALDDLYSVQPTTTARLIRELMYHLFMVEDHALHFYILAGPDIIVGPRAPKEERNVVGIIKKIGLETASYIIKTRKSVRDMMQYIGGKTVHPVFGLPGGVAKGLRNEDRERLIELSKAAKEFSIKTLETFRNLVLKNKEYLDLFMSDYYRHETYYMGLVNSRNQDEFYDGPIRVVDPRGNEYAKFPVHDYEKHLAEHVEPWTFVRFTYLRNVGWKGFVDGKDSGIISVAPLARLNVSESMATPLANDAFGEFYDTVGEKPVHYTLMNHWARVIEILYAAEKIEEIVNNEDLYGKNIRNIPQRVNEKRTGYGVVEAPRGTLIHKYVTDERGVMVDLDLIVATQNNAARMSLSIDKAAKGFIKGGNVDDGIINMVEMAYRAYDPCLACATHEITGMHIFDLNIRNNKGEIIKRTVIGD
ncbi:MAG TPA: Ni/Fe hydrogenase subunit alpha [Euryarchaeota archaeon]|nr:Ni/Fe hydrogenase subunit alpha [Euryarchaeota archaeon]